MSNNTLKIRDDNQYSNRPIEGPEVRWWREWLVKVIFGLWNEKKEKLAPMGFPPRGISQREICREVDRRIAWLKEENLWGKTTEHPYSTGCNPDHNHNWIERRVNECAKNDVGPKTSGGILKVVCVSSRKGLYEPNTELFKMRN